MSWNYMLDLYTLFSRCVCRKALCVQLPPSIILRGPFSYSVFLWDVPTKTALEALRERPSSFSKTHCFCIRMSKNQKLSICVLKWSGCILITDSSLDANVSSKWLDGRKHVLSSLSKVPRDGADVGLWHKYCATPLSKIVCLCWYFQICQAVIQCSLLVVNLGWHCVCVSPPQDPCITSTVTAQKRILRPGRKPCLVQTRNHRSSKILLPSPASISSRCWRKSPKDLGTSGVRLFITQFSITTSTGDPWGNTQTSKCSLMKFCCLWQERYENEWTRSQK